MSHDREMRPWVFAFLFVYSVAQAGTVISFPRRTCGSILRQQSFEEYVHERQQTFGLMTMLSAFDAAEHWDSYREHSPYSQNIRFGIREALSSVDRPAVWFNSGVSYRFFFEDFPRSCGFIGQKYPVGRLVLSDRFSPDQFVAKIFELTSWHLFEERVQFALTPETARLLPVEGVFDPLSMPTPLRSLLRHNPQIEYIKEGQLIADHSVDVVTDYGGEFFRGRAGEVMSRYHSQLRTGGFLFLAIPVAKVMNYEARAHFSLVRSKAESRVEGAQFFARLPGFELINAYEVEGPIGSDFPTGPVHSVISNHNPHWGLYRTLVVALRKTHHIPAVVNESLSLSEPRHFRLQTVQLLR